MYMYMLYVHVRSIHYALIRVYIRTHTVEALDEAPCKRKDRLFTAACWSRVRVHVHALGAECRVDRTGPARDGRRYGNNAVEEVKRQIHATHDVLHTYVHVMYTYPVQARTTNRRRANKVEMTTVGVSETKGPRSKTKRRNLPLYLRVVFSCHLWIGGGGSAHPCRNKTRGTRKVRCEVCSIFVRRMYLYCKNIHTL